MTTDNVKEERQDEIQDIEELSKLISPSEMGMERKSIGKVVGAKTFTFTLNTSYSSTTMQEEEKDNDAFIRPGQASVFVKTWGCGHNNSDGEYMAGLLAEHGYQVILASNQAANADVWLLNSCTVKGPSQQTFGNDIQRGLDQGKKVIVSGCVPQGEKNGKEWKDLSIIGVQQIDQVVYVVEETLKGNTVQLFKEAKELDQDGKKRKAGGAKLDLPKIRRNPFIEIIPVNTGCLNQCTYCKTKHARGDLGSYTPAEVINRVKSVLDEGVLEIWLTSEDIGAYGRDIGTSIVELLWGIIEAMEGHVSSQAMLRIGMTNPPYILEHLDEMVKILNHPRVYSFLHVPVQAGSTKVLDSMKRLYTIQDFELVCDTLLNGVSGLTLATDVICGFPTESADDFEETMRILQKYQFSVLHISQFYPRPGTPAALMKRVPTLEVKNRSRKATSFFESYTSFDHLLSSIQRVLVTESSTDGKNFVGHNKSFNQVLLPKDPRIMGQWVECEIIETSKWFIKGSVLPESLAVLEHLSVAPNRIPKLVRHSKKIVSLQSDSADESRAQHSNQREDGAVLSLGSKSNLAGKINKDNTKLNDDWYGSALLGTLGVLAIGMVAARRLF